VSDRAAFLRRAGVGAAGLSLGQLLGPAGALAGDGGGDFPAHPRWRFVFVSHQTLDPLFVATQFGAQDAAALVKCSVQWTGSPRGSVSESVKALRSAVSGKADGIAVSIIDQGAYAPQLEAARKAGIPLVAFNVDQSPRPQWLAYVGENPYSAGLQMGAEVARLVPRGEILLFAPERPQPWLERRLEGVRQGLSHAGRKPAMDVVRLAGIPKEQEAKVESMLKRHPHLRGLFAVDGLGTLAVGTVIERRGLRPAGVHGGGFDLLPGGLELVADGHLDFVVDQQAYVQGFAPVLQLFLALVSEGTMKPWDTETSVLLRAPDVRRFVETKSRFEGSSSRHDYPLRRA
jgi:simple sugar transport system substrate-binding protein